MLSLKCLLSPCSSLSCSLYQPFLQWVLYPMLVMLLLLFFLLLRFISSYVNMASEDHDCASHVLQKQFVVRIFSKSNLLICCAQPKPEGSSSLPTPSRSSARIASSASPAPATAPLLMATTHGASTPTGVGCRPSSSTLWWTKGNAVGKSRFKVVYSCFTCCQ